MMKPIATIVLAVILSTGQAYAMTRIETPGTGNGAALGAQNQVQQSGEVNAIHSGAGRMVIGGVTYAYNPLTTLVTVNGKRATVSDVRSGEIVQFQASPQGANKPALLTMINVQRQ